MISIKDTASKKALFVLTDRSQGGTSLEDGQIELMVKILFKNNNNSYRNS